jgi:hypothetical protein
MMMAMMKFVPRKITIIKYKVKLFSLIQESKDQKYEDNEENTPKITILQIRILNYCNMYPVHFLPILVFMITYLLFHQDTFQL